MVCLPKKFGNLWESPFIYGTTKAMLQLQRKNFSLHLLSKAENQTSKY